MRIFWIFIIINLVPVTFFAQQPRYTEKKFVNYLDTTEFKISYDNKDKWVRTYILIPFTFWDVDDDGKTHVMGKELCLINIEGPGTDKDPKNGLFTTYLIDSANHSKRYKVYEQEFENDKLNGIWKTYSLKGTLVTTQNFNDDSLNGLSTTYWIDGKSIMDQREYFNGRNKYIEKGFSRTGLVESETSYENGQVTGLCKEYYPDGSLKRSAVFKNGILDGVFKYFYPGGKLWIEEIFKDGKDWTIIGNYTEDGKPREKGTLKNGNGTIYLYNEDGSLREIKTIINGEEQK